MSGFDPFDSDARVMARYEAAIEAVAERFCWLDLSAIAEPPHNWFDAYLARQIAVHITCEYFDVPRRRLSLLTDRARQRIGEAIGIIEDRRDDAAFEAAYRAMCSRAQALLSLKMEGSADG